LAKAARTGKSDHVEADFGDDANVGGRDIGLSRLVIQTLYQASSVKIVMPATLTKICIQIALLISIKMK
jgi:hypothetical protein